jgi:hypothetical protein
VANVRIHGTTGETPITRFERDEAHRLKSLGGGRPSDRYANCPVSSATIAPSLSADRRSRQRHPERPRCCVLLPNRKQRAELLMARAKKATEVPIDP